MPWVRLDDEFYQHPKVVKVGPLGIAMQVSGLCYCNRFLTDGFIPRSAVPTFMDFSELDQAAFNGVGDVCWIAVQKLIDAGIWEEVDGGFQIHDYLDYQPSRATVADEHLKKQAAGQAGGLARARQVLEQSPSKIQAKSKPVPKPNPNPVPVQDDGEVETSPAPQQKTPAHFIKLTRLPNFTNRNHSKAYESIESACAAAGVQVEAVVTQFCPYFEAQRFRHGWKDPVRALAQTVHIEIKKLLQPTNNQRPKDIEERKKELERGASRGRPVQSI